MQKFGLRAIKPSSLEAKPISKFGFSKIVLVVDLHLLMGFNLRIDSCFVILESQFHLHAVACVWTIEDEAGLAESA